MIYIGLAWVEERHKDSRYRPLKQALLVQDSG